MIQLTEDFYKGLLDNLHDGVYFVDRGRGIVYWNKGAERITGYTSAEVVGSHCWAGILMHIDADGNNLCQTDCPIAQVISSGTATEADIFLYHKDGHRIPVQIRATPIVGGKGKIVGAVEIFSDVTEKVTALELVEDLQRKVFLDSLTALANRRYVEMNMQTRHDELLRYGWQFGVIMMDIDHFKGVNDRYGHATGDEALKMIARTLLHNSRPSDIIGRC